MNTLLQRVDSRQSTRNRGGENRQRRVREHDVDREARRNQQLHREVRDNNQNYVYRKPRSHDDGRDWQHGYGCEEVSKIEKEEFDKSSRVWDVEESPKSGKVIVSNNISYDLKDLFVLEEEVNSSVWDDNVDLVDKSIIWDTLGAENHVVCEEDFSEEENGWMIWDERTDEKKILNCNLDSLLLEELSDSGSVEEKFVVWDEEPVDAGDDMDVLNNHEQVDEVTSLVTSIDQHMETMADLIFEEKKTLCLLVSDDEKTASMFGTVETRVPSCNIKSVHIPSATVNEKLDQVEDHHNELSQCTGESKFERWRKVKFKKKKRWKSMLRATTLRTRSISRAVDC